APDGVSESGMAHVTLDEHGHPFRLLQGHVAGRLTNHNAPFLDEDGAGGKHVSFNIRECYGMAVVIQSGHGAKRGPQVDPDQLAGRRGHGTSNSREKRVLGIVARGKMFMKEVSISTRFRFCASGRHPSAAESPAALL